MTDTVVDARTYFDGLFSRAFKRDAFAALCTLLRVDGITSYDPIEESLAAFEDYNWMLRKVADERGPTAELRVALLMYCQAIEMDAAQELLYNLLRTVSGKPYVIGSMDHLWKRNKKTGISYPPSATTVFATIRQLANNTGETILTTLINQFFSERIRNAFSHSDYVLSPTSFCWMGGEIPLDELRAKINRAFAFFTALLSAQRKWLVGLSRGARFHKMQNYEVLELLSTSDDGVFGFSMHFSNGSKATFTRRGGKVNAINLTFERDGQVNFMVGLLDALEPIYKINGRPVLDWENPTGEASPPKSDEG